MCAVTGWLGRSRFRRRSITDVYRLAHPPSTLIIGLVGFVFFFGIAIYSNLVPNETTTWWTTAIFVGFALMSVPMILEFFIAKHEVTKEGLTYRKLFGPQKFLYWKDLIRVRYAPVMQWFRLQTQSGTVARISVLMMGLPVFAHLLLEHAPKSAIDPKTLKVLQATVKGRPPSL